jgi:oligopeptide transport system substrate-binding protein
MNRSRRPAGPALARAAAVLLVAAGTAGALACSRPARDAASSEQVFRFRLREDPPTLDPALCNDNLSEAVVVNVNRGLVEIDPETLQVRPAVAESWTISPDHLEYTFRLRDKVRFHNGRAVGAEDVAYSLLRILRPQTNSPRRTILEPLLGAEEFEKGKTEAVAGLRVVDSRTIVFRLARPFAPFLGTLAIPAAAIVPREVYEDPAKGYLRAPVGCGPFRFSRWEQSNFLELRAFDDYYGGRPALDRVLVRIIENHQSALQEYRAGGLDSLDQVPGSRDPAAAELAAEIHRYPFVATGYIGFNHALPPFKGNAKLRQAFNYAVDKDYLWKVLMPDGNIPARGILPPGVPGYDPDLPGYPHDAEKAKRLLAEAGYPGGKGLPPIALWVNTSEDNRKIAEQIQADLRAVGVAITIREVDWGAYLAAVEGTEKEPGSAQMFRFGWNLDYPDADSILRTQLHSANFGPAGNFFRYRNPEFDRLIDEALMLTDPAARADRYRRAERLAVMQDAVWLFLNYYQSSTLFKPYVKGIVLTPLGEFRIPLERLRIEKSPA